MPQSISMIPIGVVSNTVREPVDDIWGSLESRVKLDAALFTPESLAGLDQFSHVEVVFVFNRVVDAEIVTGSRHPRGQTNWPAVGIFAQRGKNRPNRIGLTVCRVKKIEGLQLTVEGLDAIDGTPVLDIKPYMREFAPRGELRQPDWSSELMKDYWS